jgi:hypothetical protein
MDWIWENPGLSCAALFAWAVLAALRLAGRGGRGSARSPFAGGGLWRALASEEGAAAAEFALAAPVLLALVLFAVQLALVAVSRRAVEGAAFAAARSAAVWVPADSDEGPNRLRLDGDSPKRERIERAAALALLPVAPAEAVAASGRPGTDVAGTLRELARETGLASPDELVRRYAAARARLRVEVRGVGEPGTGGLLVAGPDEPLTVSVTYACPLHVPIAARLLGVRDRRSGGFSSGLSARCTVRNEGTPECPLILSE